MRLIFAAYCLSWAMVCAAMWARVPSFTWLSLALSAAGFGLTLLGLWLLPKGCSS